MLRLKRLEVIQQNNLRVSLVLKINSDKPHPKEEKNQLGNDVLYLIHSLIYKGKQGQTVTGRYTKKKNNHTCQGNSSKRFILINILCMFCLLNIFFLTIVKYFYLFFDY